MEFVEVARFEVLHASLTWPWVALEPTHQSFAFVTRADRIETRRLEGETVVVGPSFPLPTLLQLPRAKPHPAGGGVPSGLRGFAVDPALGVLALSGMADRTSVLVTRTVAGVERWSQASELLGEGFELHAVIFDRTGARLWVSAESPTQTALGLLDPLSHHVFGVVHGAPFPPPAVHELHVHPQDDAVLLLAACGQDGTFARVAGWAGDDPPVAIPTALDAEGEPAGFVGFSVDGQRVHLVEDAVLRTHAWPGLLELSSVELDDGFASAYSGVVLPDGILVDGHDGDSGDVDRVMRFDPSGLVGRTVRGQAPEGMWIGRLGKRLLLTVDSHGDPALGRVLRPR